MSDPPTTDGPARDVTDLIMADHVWFRSEFAALDDLRARQASTQELRMAWEPLSARLDVHAIAEEEVFYPELLRIGDDDPQEETLDAIGDHNDIRDGLHAAAELAIGSEDWWQAVRSARVANDEHMAEEERDGIADFKQNSPAGLQLALGRRFADFLERHPTTDGVDTSDKDPDAYVREAEIEVGVRPTEASPGGSTSLGIGSLKGK